jgi:hypothetical protein
MGLLSKGDCPEYEPRANDGADILRYHCHEPFLTEILGCESGKKYRARAGGDLDLALDPQHRSRPVAPPGVAPTSAVDFVVGLS